MGQRADAGMGDENVAETSSGTGRLNGRAVEALWREPRDRPRVDQEGPVGPGSGSRRHPAWTTGRQTHSKNEARIRRFHHGQRAKRVYTPFRIGGSRSDLSSSYLAQPFSGHLLCRFVPLTPSAPSPAGWRSSPGTSGHGPARPRSCVLSCWPARLQPHSPTAVRPSATPIRAALCHGRRSFECPPHRSNHFNPPVRPKGTTCGFLRT